jgi:hypothetical protein
VVHLILEFYIEHFVYSQRYVIRPLSAANNIAFITFNNVSFADQEMRIKFEMQCMSEIAYIRVQGPT